MRKYILRSILERSKSSYLREDNTIDPLWYDEGSAWAIQDYYGGIGSLQDFTEDDWAAAEEEGWPRGLVEELCKED